MEEKRVQGYEVAQSSPSYFNVCYVYALGAGAIDRDKSTQTQQAVAGRHPDLHSRYTMDHGVLRRINGNDVASVQYFGDSEIQKEINRVSQVDRELPQQR